MTVIKQSSFFTATAIPAALSVAPAIPGTPATVTPAFSGSVTATLATLTTNPTNQLPAVPEFGSWAVADLIVLGLAFCGLIVFFAVLLARNLRQPSAPAGSPGRVKKLKKPKSPLDGRSFWLVTSIVAAMLIVFVFAFSQTFSGKALILDNWSSTVFLLLLIQVLTMILALKNDKAQRKAELDLSDEGFDQEDNSSALRKGGRLKLRSDQAGRLEKDDPQSKNEKS